MHIIWQNAEKVVSLRRKSRMAVSEKPKQSRNYQ